MIPKYLNKYHVVAPVAPDESSLINILMSELNLNVSALNFLCYLNPLAAVKSQTTINKIRTATLKQPGHTHGVYLYVLHFHCCVLLRGVED